VNEYGNMNTVGTGPFVYSTKNVTEEALLLERNPNFYGIDEHGNQLPYLDGVEFAFINSKIMQWKSFEQGEVDMIYGLPSEKIKDIVMEHMDDFNSNPPLYILERYPEMVTEFYEFNMQNEVFQDPHVRKAFSYAIDREKLYRKTLNEEAFGPGHYGITPSSFKNYSINQIEGYSYDPEEARNQLLMAGYTDGSDFPPITIELNSGGQKHSRVAFAIRQQLKTVLGIDVTLDVVPFQQKLEDAKYGRADIIRTGWVADYPSPESFLWRFYGKTVPTDPSEPSWPNTARYVNPKYDALFEEAVATASEEERLALFAEAEQLLMKDAPLIVLWYGENFRLRQSNVQNLKSNPMNFLDCSAVFIKALEPTKEEEATSN